MRSTKKITAGSIFAALTLLFSMVSCEKQPVENDATTEVETVTIHLNAPETKTALVDDKSVIWSSGDKIVINRKTYDVTVNPDNPAVATVENVVKADEYYALYVPVKDNPNETSPNYLYKDGTYSFLFQATASYSQGTFSPFANPMAAYGKDTNLHFYNIGSVIKVGLTGNGETISSLTLITNNSSRIAGLVNCTEEQIRTGDFSSIKFNDEYDYMRNSCTIDCNKANVVLSSNPTWFYFVTAPFSEDAGISLIAEDTNGNAFVKIKTDAFSCKRSELVEMSPIGYVPLDPLTLTGGTHSANALSVTANGSKSLGVRYLAVQKSAWDYFMEKNNNDINSTAGFLLRSLEPQEITSEPSTVQLTKAYNTTFNSVAITAENSYKVIASYGLKDISIGKYCIIDAVTPAAEGPAPTLDITFPYVDFERINAIIKTDGANASVWLFTKEDYEQLVAEGKSDSDIMKEYGKPLSESDIETAHTTGCQWSWWGLKAKTDYVILFSATSSAGKETIVKKEVRTTYYIFDQETTTLETVSTSGTVITSLFSGFGGELSEITLNNLTIKKVPGMDVFVIENLFKGIDKLQNVGFIDQDGTFLTIIDARNAAAVDILFAANKMGISNTKYLGFSKDMSFGCYATLADVSIQDYPLGTYNKSTGVMEFSAIVLGDSSRLYGTYKFKLIISADAGSNGLSNENFNKATSTW